MQDLKIIPYPYLWQNYPDNPQAVAAAYMGKQANIMCDPNKTLEIINKTNSISKKILVFVQFLERKEREGAWSGKLLKPLRYLLAHLPTIQTLKAAKCWHQVSKAFEERDWDTALVHLHQLNSRKEKEQVIRFPYASWEEFKAKSGVNPRDNLIHLSDAVTKASWVRKKYDSDGLFAVYISLMGAAYFNRALKAYLEQGRLSPDAKLDIERAKIFTSLFGRGLQEYNWHAIKALEQGSPVKA